MVEFAGFGAGLAGSFKLSGLTVLAGVAVVWICVVAIGHRRGPPLTAIAIAVLGLALTVGLAAAMLLLLNPFLDPDPLGRFIKMVQHRAVEMNAQLLLRSWWPIKGTGDRLQFIFGYVFEQAVMVHHPVAGAASLALWLVGFGSIVRRVYQSFRQGMLDPAGAALLVATFRRRPDADDAAQVGPLYVLAGLVQRTAGCAGRHGMRPMADRRP